MFTAREAGSEEKLLKRDVRSVQGKLVAGHDLIFISERLLGRRSDITI